MYFAPKPLDEEMRLADLLAYGILDTPAEQEFEDLVELASLTCDCPIATITFVDRDRQWFKAQKGMSIQESARNTSLCGHTIMRNDPLVVVDASADERFSGYPDVCAGMKIRFYAGVPIISASGHPLGTVCVMDQRPRTPDNKQVQALTLIARQVTVLLDLRLKYKLVQAGAGQRLEQQQQALQTALQEQDLERQTIGEALHENVAQVLASTLHYLHMAEQTPQLQQQLVQKAHAQVKNALLQVRSISRMVHPFPVDLVELGPLISEFLEARSRELPYIICFEPVAKQRGFPKESASRFSGL